MKSVLFLLVTFILSNSHFAYAGEKISLSSRLLVESCDDAGACTEIKEASKVEPNSMIELSKFHKGNSAGIHGESNFQTSIEGVPFKGKIFVNKGREGYSIYTVLRSGPGTKRTGVTKTVQVKEISELQPIVLIDKPILIKGKKFQSKLIIQSPEQSLQN